MTCLPVDTDLAVRSGVTVEQVRALVFWAAILLIIVSPAALSVMVLLRT